MKKKRLKYLLISFRATSNFPRAFHFLRPLIIFKHSPSIVAYSAIITGLLWCCFSHRMDCSKAHLGHKKKKKIQLSDQSFAQRVEDISLPIYYLYSNPLNKCLFKYGGTARRENPPRDQSFAEECWENRFKLNVWWGAEERWKNQTPSSARTALSSAQ